MSNSQNPYDLVQAELDPAHAHSQPAGGIWRSNRFLVLDHRATLPAICFCCGGPATNWGQHTLRVLRPVDSDDRLTFFVMLLFAKRTTIGLGLCNACEARRRFWLAIGWIVGLAGLAVATLCFPGAFSTPIQMQFFVGFPLGALLVAIGFAIGATGSQMARAVSIDSSHLRLRGAHPDVLKLFPELPPSEDMED